MTPAQQTHLNLDASENWPTEKALQKCAMRWLRSQGALCLHMSGFFSSAAGWPDIIGLAPSGRLLLIELKRAAGKLRPAQEGFITKAAQAGHTVHVCRTMREVMTAFAGLYEAQP